MKFNYLRTAAEHRLGSVACHSASPKKLSHGSFLRTFLLLAIMLVGGIGVSWGQDLLPTTRYSLDNVGTKSFALVNVSEGKALYVEKEQNCSYGVYATSFASTNAGYTFVLEAPTGDGYNANDYLLKFRTPSGEDYNVYGYGTAYLNTTSWNSTFVMGQSGSTYTNGRDMDNGAVWTIIDNGDGTYKIQNKATGKYLSGSGANDTGASWSLCSVSAGCKVTFGSDGASTGSGTVSASANGETITSGSYVAYGTNVTFTAEASSSLSLTWRFKKAGDSDHYAATWDVTVTEDINVTHEFSDGLHFYAYTNNGTWGTVNVKTSDNAISGTDIHVTPWPANIVYTATPAAGCSFAGWYKDSSHTQPASNDESYLNEVFTYSNVGNGSSLYTIDAGDNNKKKITLYAKFNAPTQYTVTWDPEEIPSGCDAWYTIGDDETKVKETRSVTVGTKITYHATDTGNDQQIINGWRNHGTSGSTGWLKYGGTYEINSVNEDLNVIPEFQTCIRVFVTAGEGGTATVSGGNGKKYFNSATPTYTATPNSGYSFDGWYNTSGTKVSSEVSYNASFGGTGDFTLEARFKKNHEYTPKPTCGGKYLGQDKLEQGANITAFEMLEGGHAKVTTSETNDGYVSFFFENPINLTEINKWTVGCKDDASGNVYYVAFCKDGNAITDATFYTNAADRTLEAEHKSKLSSVDEIRIGFKANTTTTIDFFYLEIKHALGSKDPVLASPTTSEMEIMEGSTLQLRITDSHGFWREYTDDTYTATTDKISGEWKPSYDITDLTPGVHYFGVVDEGDCAIGNHHKTNITKVKVNVKELPNCTVVTDKNGEANWDGAHLHMTYTGTVEGKTVTVKVNNTQKVFEPEDDNCNSVRMYQSDNTELLVNAPDGYRVKYVKVNFCKESKYNVSFNGGSAIPSGTADFVEYTQNATNQYKDMVRMVIRSASDQTECTELHIQSVYVKIQRMKLDEDRTIQSSGKERKYWIYVPENVIDGTAKNVPVVFSLHGGGEDYKPSHYASLNFNSLADQNNFIVVYPCAEEQTFPLFNPNPAAAWLCTGNKNDDTQLFEDIIEELKSNTEGYSIDEKKIYMTGFSVGGMMAYAAANCMSDKIAAFASISGFPMNETHLRHHGDRPVPFLHVHGTKDDFVRYNHMPTVIDNMIFRNGLSSTPVKTTGSADLYDNQTTTFTKYVYGNESDKSQTPYIYYEVGTGFGSGMGHNDWCRLAGNDVEKVMWDFFSGRSLPNTISEQWEIKTDINTQGFSGLKNGWQINTSTGVLAQYGESGGYTSTGQNVYHSIQLKSGQQYLKFNITGAATNYIMVRVVKLAELSAFDELNPSPITYTEKVILDNKAYKVKENGSMSIPFDAEEGEYLVSIMKGGQYDNTTISNIVISQTGSKDCEEYTGAINTDFVGYFNYNNRLFAQWNFDLTDGYRTNARKLEVNAQNAESMWHADLSNTNYAPAQGETPAKDATFGTIIFSNQKPIGNLTEGASDTDINNYGELTYNGTEPIAIAAGLKFKAAAGQVKIHVDLTNGQVSGAHLELAKGVKMYVPYVENSYRNDTNDGTPLDKDKTPSEQQDEYNKYKNCMHHINRDIVYIALKEGDAWSHITNKCLDEDHKDQELFRNGGTEFVNGKTYNKADYMGIQGTPCFIEFSANSTTIDRIGVNRNLIYSFYTEYINELGMAKPNTRFRVVGSPSGAKIANIGEYTTYEGAIAMTYGGWLNTEGSSSYINNENYQTTDAWTDLGVINYEPDNSAIHFKTWGNMQSAQASTNSVAAIDGFPVVTLLDTEARSGSLMPSSIAPKNANTESVEGCVAGVDYVKQENINGDVVYIPNYHALNEGKYMVPTTDKPYKANITPWSLPSRGGYVKFEPSIPGVLNMNVVQNGGHAYYITDEFGKLVDQSTIFSTTGMKQNIDKSNGCYTIEKTDYVKHSLNVEPGKTYYIFSNTTGLGIAGFYFEPFVNHNGTERGRIYISVREATLNAGADDSYALPSNLSGTENITSPDGGSGKNYTVNYSNKAVKVTLKRKFKANEWSSITLPYSMNQVQMEQVFGPGTRVVLLRDVQDRTHNIKDKTTCTLICHENQDIIAGYPYFILPTKEIGDEGVTTYASLPETAPEIVNVKSVGPNTNSYEDKTYGGIDDYTFKGNFEKMWVKNGSWYVGSGLLKKLTNTNGGFYLNPYRAWLDLNDGITNAAWAKKISAFEGISGEADIEDTVTGTDEISIDELLEQQGIFTKKATIYNINGQVVRQNADNLNDMPRGVYIVNGHKYVVK